MIKVLRVIKKLEDEEKRLEEMLEPISFIQTNEQAAEEARITINELIERQLQAYYYPMSREEEPHIDTNMNTVCEPQEEENEDSEELREEHARDRRGRNDEDEE